MQVKSTLIQSRRGLQKYHDLTDSRETVENATRI